jgi:HEXXH motif-containing protein
MASSAGELRRAHADIGPAVEVIGQRRALYSAVHDMVTGGRTDPDVDVDLLDSPAVRGNLGEVLAGTGTYRADLCVALSALVATGFEQTVGSHVVRMASTTTAATALCGALTRIAASLPGRGPAPALLADPDDPASKAAFEQIVEGVHLAVDSAAELALDLLPHVSLFAVLTAAGSERLGSASAREYPGLILVPPPESPLEAAEALIHEGAHQKFFDLATTRSLFAPELSDRRFVPSWAEGDSPGWAIVQTFAAWHAYTCLAAFAATQAGRSDLPAHSLLPHAEVRAAEIGEWLLDNGGALGPDGHSLLFHTIGRNPTDAYGDVAFTTADLGFDPASPEWIVRQAEGRTLLARRGSPLELYWLPPNP